MNHTPTGPVWRDRVSGTLYPSQESVDQYFGGPAEQLERLNPVSETDALRNQAKRALFEAEQIWPGIADRPEMQALRELLGLGEAPPPDKPV